MLREGGGGRQGEEQQREGEQAAKQKVSSMLTPVMMNNDIKVDKISQFKTPKNGDTTDDIKDRMEE